MEHKWFESWFDSSYYHLLYEHRDESEARDFLSRLLDRVHLPAQSRVLDLACGKGRHSIYLNDRGYDVTGADLSPENIRYCKQFENEHLHFYEHDMRKVLRVRYFDAVFNLFTSFGYFERETENEQVIKAVASSLKTGGYFVLDFLNVQYAIQHLNPAEVIQRGDVRFAIQRKIEAQKIVKEIHVEDNAFREEVRIIRYEDFKRCFAHSGLTVLNVYGDYQLGEFNPETSQRLIFITRKI
ncbi:MAG: methyltransferase domain-containing protein [Bacteroidia bacterium]